MDQAHGSAHTPKKSVPSVISANAPNGELDSLPSPFPTNRIGPGTESNQLPPSYHLLTCLLACLRLTPDKATLLSPSLTRPRSLSLTKLAADVKLLKSALRLVSSTLPRACRRCT